MDRQQIAASILGDVVNSGVAPEDVPFVIKTAAEAVRVAEEAGVSLSTIAESGVYPAEAIAAVHSQRKEGWVGPAAAFVGTGVSNTVGNLVNTVAGNTVSAIGGALPYIAAGSLALPAYAAYSFGQSGAETTDVSKETAEVAKHRELENAYRVAAERLERLAIQQRKRDKQG